MTAVTVAAVTAAAMAIRALLPSEGCDRECSGDSEFAEHVGVGGIGFDYSYELAIFTAAYKLGRANGLTSANGRASV